MPEPTSDGGPAEGEIARFEQAGEQPFTPSGRPAPPSPRRAAIAWLVIGLVVLTMIVANTMLGEEGKPGDESPVEQVVFNVQGRYLVGTMHSVGGLPGTDAFASQFERQLPDLNIGAVEQRLGAAVLTAEIIGPARAAELLNELAAEINQHDPDLSTIQQQVLESVYELYLADPGQPLASEAANPAERAGRLDDAARDRLAEQLGWLGRLAVHPEGGPDEAARAELIQSAQRVFWVVISGVTLVGLLAVAGLVGLIICTVLFAMKKQRMHFHPADGSRQVLYVETFAIWLVLFVAMQLVLAVVGGGLAMAAVAFFASLIALAWPVVAGVDWATIRKDAGMTLGRRPWLEPLAGLAAYAMTLPIVGIGLLAMFVLAWFASMMAGQPEPLAPSGGPAHPIVAEFANADWQAFAMLLFVGAVAAPIVEEIVFRGVLYQHLRSATRHWTLLGSIVCSTAVNTFVFAAVHPQGIVAIPLLMSLAVGFTLVREWRGTVIPAIVMHAFSNGLILTLLFVVLNV